MKMKNSNTYKHYIRDLVYILKERRFELSNKTNKDEFNEGILFAYNSILDTIENQTVPFQIDLKDIGYNDFENYQKKHS